MEHRVASPGLAGRGRIASEMRSTVRCNPGEGFLRETKCVETPPSPRPSPRKRGEGEAGSILRAQLVDLGVARQMVGALAIDRIHHDALAVLQRGLADEGAQCRLMVDLAEGDLAER